MADSLAPAELQVPANLVVQQVVCLAREIKQPRKYVGESAFILFGLLKRMRVWMWQGADRIDLLGHYAPWCLTHLTHEAVVDAIACKVEKERATDERIVVWLPGTSIHRCNHFVGCISAATTASSHGDGSDGQEGDSCHEPIAESYRKLDQLVIGTIANGDCAFDVMCLMLGVERTEVTRDKLRFDMAEFLLENAENKAVIAALRLCSELTLPDAPADADVRRDSNLVFSSLHGDGACDHDTEEATDSLPPKQFSKDVLDAVQWACGIKKTHEVALQDLCRALPAWCVEEQVQKYKSRDPAKARRTKKRKTCGVYANPTLQKRLEAAEEFTRFIRGRGIDIEQAKRGKKGLLSLPYGTFGAFLETVPELKKRCTTKARKDKWRQFYLRAERSYRQDKGLYAFGEQAEAAKHLPRGSGKKAYIRDQFRRRAMGAGRKQKGASVEGDALRVVQLYSA